MPLELDRRIASHDIVYPAAIPFALVHLSCFAAIWTGVTWPAMGLCFALYWIRIFAIGAGYHRYFSHRAFSTGRASQFLLAFLAQSSAQNSVLWWAAKHRHHHLYSDTEHDVHSPLRRGFLYSHVGWIFDRKHSAADLVKVEDLTCYPELLWLHRLELVPALLVGTLCFWLAGWPGVVVGFLWSTVLVYHSTFCINSLAHVRGSRRYVTGDDSRNNWLLALFTMGEGWHNNHHACQSSARQGFRWWEVDATYYILWLLSKIGVLWDLKTPSEQVLRGEHRLSARVVQRTGEQLAIRFNADRIARAIILALHNHELIELRARLYQSRHDFTEVLFALHLPGLPQRLELEALAKSMFSKARSLEEIVDHAYRLLLIEVGTLILAAAPAA